MCKFNLFLCNFKLNISTDLTDNKKYKKYEYNQRRWKQIEKLLFIKITFLGFYFIFQNKLKVKTKNCTENSFEEMMINPPGR